MEVKEIYLDLKEWAKYASQNWTVWSLESEAFKDPLTLKLVYSDDDKSYYEAQLKEVKKLIDTQKEAYERSLKTIKDYESFINTQTDHLSMCSNKIKEYQWQITDLKSELATLYDLVKNLVKDTATLETRAKSHGTDIDNIWEVIDENKPVFYQETEFIAGNGVYYYKPIYLYGRYIVVKRAEVLSSNEYVLNRDSVETCVQEISWEYTPFYQLKADNDIDKPTGVVRLTVLFFPM